MFILIFDFFQEGGKSTLKETLKKWDIGGDTWNEPFGGPGLLEIAYLTLDELEMEISLVDNDDYVDDDDVVVL